MNLQAIKELAIELNKERYLRGMNIDPQDLLKLIAVAEAASVIRYEWNIGLSEPAESSLANLFKAVRELEDDNI